MSTGAPQARFFLRPLGNPLSLGFIGLAGASTALAGLQLGWVPTTQSQQVALAVLLIAPPAQLISSVFGFLARDAVAGTGMGTLAVSWLTTGVLTLTSPPGMRSTTLGFVLFYLGAAVLVSAVVALSGKVLAGVVLTCAAARFVVTGAYEYLGGSGLEHAAGWVGIALAAITLYAVLAFEVEDIKHTTVLPTLRRGRAAEALDADAPLGPVDTEAGVRNQL